MFNSAVDKDAAMEALRELLAAHGATWIISIAEAWTVVVENLDSVDRAKGIANDPRRAEVISYQIEDEELGIISAMQTIFRSDQGKPRLGPLQWHEQSRSVEGRMVGLLPKRRLSS
jgi:hypothetical protein